MHCKDKNDKATLKESLFKFNKQQLKLFYAILVRCWASQRAFISTQSFRNLWCELNYLCSLVDEGFPDPYDDFELLKSFCHAHPYYFIDILGPEIIINLFCEYLDDRIDVLASIAQKLDTEGLRAVYELLKEPLGLTETADEFTAQAEEHINMFS